MTNSSALLRALVVATLLMATVTLMTVAVNTARAGGMLMASADGSMAAPPVTISFLTE